MENTTSYKELTGTGHVPIKAWVNGVPFESKARLQLMNTASLPIIHKWVAAMPDVHLGLGATVGSVIPTKAAIIPAAVGVDLGCGMMAVKTSLKGGQLPDNLAGLRSEIEAAVPHGRSNGRGSRDKGSWQNPPKHVDSHWQHLVKGFAKITDKYPTIGKSNNYVHLGTLGTGNHFIEICLDEHRDVWIMLHSGSRGVGNKIGSTFIELAKKDMGQHLANLPDKNLAYFQEGSTYFDDYVEAVSWAQDFARANRQAMMEQVLDVMRQSNELPPFEAHLKAVNCHHNYVQKEHHYGADVWVTRKGAVRAGAGDWGIIPGSMGARSYIVSGKGNPESFCSCSHGAGRVMSRTQAKKQFSLKDHKAATKGVECRKDKDVVDETPGAYKDIDAVMAAQKDLVKIEYTLKQILCVKG